jgi:hypothetical protein
MRQRCENPKNKDFANYGERGIRVCERWSTYENFLADMGFKPSKHGLDRRDNDGNYEPNNCRWATLSEQASNQRRITKIDVGGEKITMAEASRRFGVLRETISYRLRHGWTVQQALGIA